MAVAAAALWRIAKHTAEFPEIIEAKDLPPTWLAEPPGATTIEFGDEWLNGLSAALLLVPSVVVPEEYNVLINPLHPDAVHIKSAALRQYICDPRLKTGRR
jgi:RES domain-containing protein